MEQWENLSEYFLRKVPTLPGFTGSKGISSTARYARIKGYLQNKKIPVVIAFVVSFAQDFRKFIKTFETNAPLIHLLYQKCLQLLHTVFDKFLKAEVFLVKKGDQGYAMKHVKNLKQVNVRLQSNHKTSCSFGSQTELQFKKSKLDELEKKRLKQNMEEALTESAGYLLEKLPIDEQVVRDAQYLCHQNNGGSKGVLAIKRLCYNVCRTLKPDALKKIFNMKDDDSTDSLIDVVTEEFKLFQLEKIPSAFYEAKPKEKKREVYSYWKYAYGLLDVAATDTDNDSKYVRIDHFWRNVGGIVDIEGRPKYLKLVTFVNLILTLSHGNADPERGFSITKQHLQLHGNKTDENTLNALRNVKDYLVRNGGSENFEVTIDLISKCKDSHSQYEIYKAEKEEIERRLLEDVTTKKKETENQDRLADIERDIGVLQNGIKMAEKIVKEGNEEVQSHLLKKVLNRNGLLQSNMKVATGVKRKEELSLEIRELKKKRARVVENS
jgi:hypothetical protein